VRAPRTCADARDGGSMALELALLTPVFFLMLSLVLAYGRFASVTGLTESAARDAARAATKSRSYDEARDRVAAITKSTLSTAPASCSATGSGHLESDNFLPGDFVTVVVTCDIDYSDLGLPGAPGSKQITRQFTSPLDPYRGVR
jgi:Flp pilus assembly protein TadG